MLLTRVCHGQDVSGMTKDDELIVLELDSKLELSSSKYMYRNSIKDVRSE